ncbi:MAG: hypothetical protein V4485_01710 [Pseudomonadota bacterium]
MSNYHLLASGFDVGKKAIEHAATQHALSSGVSNKSEIVTSAVLERDKVIGVNARVERFENRSAMAIAQTQISICQMSLAQATYMDKVNSLLGSPESGGIHASVEDFLLAAKDLADNIVDPTLLECVITAGLNMCGGIAGVAQGVNNLRFQADGDIDSTKNDTNALIKDIFELNKNITKSATSVIYHDDRDKMLNNLASLIPIKVSYGDKGEALISTLPSITLVGRDFYAELGYSPASSVDDFLIEASPPDITILHKNDRDHITGSAYNLVSSPSTARQVNSGKLLGLMNVRNVDLPAVTESLDRIASSVADQINKIYNSGSGVPPSTRLTSNKIITLTDYTTWSGKMKVDVLGSDGRPKIMNNGAALRSLEVDFDKIYGQRGKGKLTTQELINEINAQFNSGVTQQRLALGEITPPAGVTVLAGNEQYLLSDVKLVGSGAIASDGTFNFQMDLDNQSAFDAKVQILDVRVFDAADIQSSQLAASALPGGVTVDAGDHIKTGDDISVKIPLGGAKATIAVKIRVLGANGVREEGYATFQIDNPISGDDKLNARICGTPSALAGLNAGGVVAKSALSSTPVLTAKLVDEEGFVISSTDTQASGRLVLEAASGYSVAINGETSSDDGVLNIRTPILPTRRDIAHYFGFNNFITGADKAITMNVRSDLVSNPLFMSLGQTSQVPATMQKVVTGDIAASAKLDIVGNIPVAGNTISIEGVSFTFVAGPTLNENEIEIGVTEAQTIINMIAKLNAVNNTTSLFNNLVSFSIGNTASSLICTAQIAGTWGNGISINSNINGVGNLWHNTAATPVLVTNLALGTDKEIEQSVTNFAYEISTGSKEVMVELGELLANTVTFNDGDSISNITTVVQYVVGIVTIITASCNIKNRQATAAREVTEEMIKTLQKESRIDRDKVMMNAYEWEGYNGALARMISMWRDNDEKFLRALGG